MKTRKKRAMTSRFLGKSVEGWKVTNVKRSNKAMKKGTSDSYTYTYTLTNARKGKSMTVCGYQMKCLVEGSKTIDEVITGKNINVSRGFRVKANKIKSI